MARLAYATIQQQAADRLDLTVDEVAAMTIHRSRYKPATSVAGRYRSGSAKHRGHPTNSSCPASSTTSPTARSPKSWHRPHSAPPPDRSSAREGKMMLDIAALDALDLRVIALESHDNEGLYK